MKIDLVDGASSGTVQTALSEQPVAWLHEVVEPQRDGQRSSLLSRDSENPWRHWREDYKAKCTFKTTPLFAARCWHPIETAPKDGTLVDFYVPNGGTARARADDYWSGADWLKRATHWMPLPAPPGTV